MATRRTSRPVLAALLLLATLPLLVGFGGVQGICQTACASMTGAAMTHCADKSAARTCCEKSAPRPAPTKGECPWLAKLVPAVPPVGSASAPPPMFVAALPALVAVPLLSPHAQTAPRPTPRHPPATPVSLSVRLNC